MKAHVMEYFLNKVAVMRPATLLKKILQDMFFLWILRSFKNTFFYTTLRWLLRNTSGGCSCLLLNPLSPPQVLANRRVKFQIFSKPSLSPNKLISIVKNVKNFVNLNWHIEY